jgi:hypothetical protein
MGVASHQPNRSVTRPRKCAGPSLCAKCEPALLMINPISRHQDNLSNWLIDAAGNIAISSSDLALLARIQTLGVPMFVSSEQAVEWGSYLDAEQRATLVDIQRTASNAAFSEPNLQRMVSLATQSQLMREAAEAAPSDYHSRH